MSDVTAAATLSLAIDTGDAAAKLDKLKLAYGQLKGELANGLPSTGISKEAESQIANLKKLANDQRAAMAVLSGQVDDLTNRLTKGLGSAGKAAEELGKSLKTSIQAGAGSLSGAFKLDETQVNALKDRMKRLGVESASALSSGLTNANFKAATDAASAFEQNTVRSLTKVIATAKLYEATLAEFGEETALSKFGSGYASGAFKEQAETNLKLLREQELAAKRAAEVEKYLAAEQKKALTEEARLSQLRIDTHVRSVKAREATERAYTAWWAAELDKRDRLEKAAPVKSVTNSAERVFGNFLTASPKGQQAIIDKVQMAALLDAEAATARFGAGIAGLVPRMGELKAAQTAVIPSIKTATVEQHNWNKAAKDGHAFARGLSGSLGALWMTYGNLVPLMAGAALAGGFKQAITAGSEFAYQLTFVKALGGETAQSVAQIGAAALELSKTSMYGPGELANGLRMLSQAGLSARDSLSALPVAMNLATVGEMSMEQATLTLVGVMNAFGMGVTDLSHIGDMFAKAAALSQTSVSGMTEAMKTASVVHDQYGASIEDTATAITLLAKVNITGTAAGTSYRNMLKDLYTPSREAARVMEDLGIKTKDASGKLRDAPAIIADLKTKLQGFTQASQTDILGKIFSERGGKEAIQMLGAVGEEWDTLKAKISNSEGFMAGVTAELEMTTKGRFKQALNTMQANMVSAFDASEGSVRKLADALRNLADSPEFISGIKAIVGAMANMAGGLVTLTPLLVDFGMAWAVFKGVGLASAGITAASAALTGLGTSLTIIKAEAALAGGGLTGLVSGIKAATGAAGVAAGATGLGGLGAAIAFLTNPVTLAVAALGALAYAAYKLKEDTPAGIVQVNNFNAVLDRQIAKLKESNAELERKNRLQNTGSDIDRDAAQANLDTLRKERKALEERVAARTAKARSSGNLQDLDRAENANTLDEQRIRQNKDAEIAQIQKIGELEKQQVRNDELNLKSYLAQARQGLKDLKDDAFHAKKNVKTTLIEAAIGQMEAGGLDQAGLRAVQRNLDRYMQEGRQSLLGSGTQTYVPPKTGASTKSAESAAAAARRRANKDAERDEKATIASYTERQNAEIASLASRAQNKLISEERNQMELVAIYAKYDDVIAQQYEAGISRLKTLQANAKADEKDALKAALTEMETAQAKFEADKLLRLQQSKDREQGIIKASNEATNKFIAEQEAAVQKQLEDLQEARVKSKMSGREEAQYDAGRNAELVFRKEEAAQLERIRGLRQDLIDQNMAAGQDFIAAVANAEGNSQLAAYVAQLEALIKKRGELVNKATAVAGDSYDFTREFSTGWDKAFKEYEKAATNSAANAREVFNASTNAMSDGLTQFFTTGKIGWQGLANTALNAVARVMANRMTAEFMGIIDWMFNSSPIVPSPAGFTSTPGFSGGDLGGGIRFPSANGNVFSGAPGLHQYVNTVQDSPKVFAFDRLHKYAKGGVFAEAGPEAVMPLARDSNGRLGVRAQGGDGTGAMSIRVEMINNGTPQKVTSTQPSFDARGLVLSVITEDIARNGPATTALATKFSLSQRAY